MTVFYPDVSHFQAGLSLAGAQLVMAKATQGTSVVDSSYASFRSQASQRNIRFAAYHWIDGTAAKQQAAHAFSIVGNRVPLMLDAEVTGATVSQVNAIASEYRRLGGTVHLVYLPHWWWQRLGSPSLRPLASAELNLVSSNYPANGYSENGPGWAPYGGMTPSIWQYTDSQSFNGMRVDFNAYKGTLAQLWSLMGGDMEQTDRLAYTTMSPSRTVGNVLADLSNFRDYQYSIPAASGVNDPQSGSRFGIILQAAEKILNATAPAVASVASPTQDQVDQAVLKAMQDPGVQAALAAAIAAQLKAT